MKILVAIPLYDGKLYVETARCLMDEFALSMVNGDILSMRFLPYCSHPAMGRNQLVTEFLDTDFDRLFFLDSDVTFEPGALLKLAHSTSDFVGGCYRFKCEKEDYPVGWLADQDELWANELGLLEVASLPGGFLSLSRRVFESFIEKFPDRKFEHFEKVMHAFFYMPYHFGKLYGEDANFCNEWREMGEQVYLDPEISLTHWQNHVPYKGHIGNWLKNRGSANDSQ